MSTFPEYEAQMLIAIVFGSREIENQKGKSLSYRVNVSFGQNDEYFYRVLS
jgi:hypothetical protein